MAGLPDILIEFKTAGLTAIQRSARGIVALILKDSTDITFDSKTYNALDEVDASDWTADNLGYITDAFLGVPKKVICVRIASDAANYTAALAMLKVMKWNWLAVPGLADADRATICAWVAGCRTNDRKSFKLVQAGYASDNEGIVNFASVGLKAGSTSIGSAAFCARLAGVFAGLPFSRSSTYFEFPEITEITHHTDPTTDITAGKMILINPDGRVKIGRGVNSLTTYTATKGQDFSKIRIVEEVDLTRDDIHDTFDRYYVGDVVNSYDNKVLFLAAVNAYFMELARQDIMDPSWANKAEIDIDAQRIYIIGKGVDPADMSDQQIKEYNTGSVVYARASVKFLDAMEDLAFTIYM